MSVVGRKSSDSVYIFSHKTQWKHPRIPSCQPPPLDVSSTSGALFFHRLSQNRFVCACLTARPLTLRQRQRLGTGMYTCICTKMCKFPHVIICMYVCVTVRYILVYSTSINIHSYMFICKHMYICICICTCCISLIQDRR